MMTLYKGQQGFLSSMAALLRSLVAQRTWRAWWRALAKWCKRTLHGGRGSAELDHADGEHLYTERYERPVIEADVPGYIKSLTDAYNLAYPWWEVVEAVRKMIFCGLFVFFKPGSTAQLVLGFLAAVGFLSLYHNVKPYDVRQNNLLQELCQFTLFATLLAALVIQINREGSGLQLAYDKEVIENDGIGWMLIVLTLSNILLAVFLAFVDVRITQSITRPGESKLLVLHLVARVMGLAARRWQRLRRRCADGWTRLRTCTTTTSSSDRKEVRNAYLMRKSFNHEAWSQVGATKDVAAHPLAHIQTCPAVLDPRCHSSEDDRPANPLSNENVAGPQPKLWRSLSARMAAGISGSGRITSARRSTAATPRQLRCGRSEQRTLPSAAKLPPPTKLHFEGPSAPGCIARSEVNVLPCPAECPPWQALDES